MLCGIDVPLVLPAGALVWEEVSVMGGRTNQLFGDRSDAIDPGAVGNTSTNTNAIWPDSEGNI